MKAAPSGIQWATSAATCALVTALIGQPRTLPDPLRYGVERGVDEVARACLWAWGEPTDALDNPCK